MLATFTQWNYHSAKRGGGTTDTGNGTAKSLSVWQMLSSHRELQSMQTHLQWRKQISGCLERGREGGAAGRFTKGHRNFGTLWIFSPSWLRWSFHRYCYELNSDYPPPRFIYSNPQTMPFLQTESLHCWVEMRSHWSREELYTNMTGVLIKTIPDEERDREGRRCEDTENVIYKPENANDAQRS